MKPCAVKILFIVGLVILGEHAIADGRCSSIKIENNTWKGGNPFPLTVQIGDQSDADTHTIDSRDEKTFQISGYPIGINSQATYGKRRNICITEDGDSDGKCAFIGHVRDIYTESDLAKHDCVCDVHGNDDEIHCHHY